jgi:DNA-binding NarL/FixJ family response regulator
MRVLVVDDYPQWRSKVREMLDWADIVGEACDGLEAVEKAAALRPDIVILDLNMPRLNGLEAAKRIRQTSPSTAIVFLTQNSNEDVMEVALGVGHAYVLKSNAGTDLLTAIRIAQAAAASDSESGSS